MSSSQLYQVICLALLLAISISVTNGSIITKSKNSRQMDPPPTDIQFSRHDSAPLEEPECDLDPDLVEEIQSYQDVANLIVDTVVNGKWKGRTYNELAKFVDKYNHRLFGTQMLEDSIDYMMDKMKAEGLENVRGEEVLVPQWKRGEESANILEPRQRNLKILGLGKSIGTPAEGITADVIVVHDFGELWGNVENVTGKIVVFNQGWRGSYGETSAYRSKGAIIASKAGGIAVLVESLAPFSLANPHTGSVEYEEGIPQIPAASITKEDAEYLSRIQSRGQPIKMTLTMLDEVLPMTISRNAIGEIVGEELPDEIVAVSGHVDSWDVGQGAMDDGGGVFISTEALAVIKHLELTSRRTLQVILWTAEEAGLYGVQGYLEQHRDELLNMTAIFESDGGTFQPKGLEFAGTDEASCIVQEILNLLAPTINTTSLERYPSVSSDISVLIDEGVPGLSLSHVSNSYFWYHHSAADTMTVQDSDEMDQITALWAVTSYVLADLSVALPRAYNTSESVY